MGKFMSWLGPKEKALEKKILAEYSGDAVRRHLEYLAGLTRRAGTEDERKAAEYIKGKLEEYNVTGHIYEFDAYIGPPGNAEFEVISPVKKSLPCLARTFITPTPPDGIKAELILVPGTGLEKDYEGLDVRGKIALIEPGYREGRVEAAQIAEEKGAIGQIHITLGIGREISIGQIRYTWGNPTPDTMNKVPMTPLIAICNEDGKYLIELMKKGPVVVRLKTDAWRGYKKIRLPMGTINGMKEPEKYVLLGGHYCSWFSGAVDNAAANSLMLEMARIFSKNRKDLNRGIKFVWWPGHEQGTYAGSTWFLDNFWDDVRDNGIAYLVMDAIGRMGSSGYEAFNTEEIRKFHEMLIRDVLGEEVKSNRVTKVGDQSFWGMGLPSIMGNTTFTAEKTAAMGGKPHWYSHTIEDTLDKVEMEAIVIPFQVNAVSILRLCNCPVLPFDYITVAEEFKKRLYAFQKEDQSLIDLTSLITQMEELEKKVEALNKGIEKNLLVYEKRGAQRGLNIKFKEINACLMELSRILMPALSSKAGKYGQDPFGSKYKLIPTLQPLERLRVMDRDSEEYKALLTSLLRERNKLSDTFKLANNILSNVLD